MGEVGEGGDSPLLVVPEALGHVLGHAAPQLARVALHPRVAAQRAQQRLQRGRGRRHLVVVVCPLFAARNFWQESFFLFFFFWSRAD
jgi:hypothetical protein